MTLLNIQYNKKLLANDVQPVVPIFAHQGFCVYEVARPCQGRMVVPEERAFPASRITTATSYDPRLIS